MKKALISLMLFVLVSGCSQVLGGIASAALGGGGPSLDAQAQIGKENTSQESFITGQNIKTNGNLDMSRPKVRSDNVGSVVVNEVSLSLITLIAMLAVVAGIFLALPTPNWLKIRKK